MKILHLISQTPDFTGSGKYIQALVSCAAENGHQNYLVAGVQKDFSLPHHLIPRKNTLFVKFNTPAMPFALTGMSDVMPYTSTVFSQMTVTQVCQYENAFKKAIKRVELLYAGKLCRAKGLPWLLTVLKKMRHRPWRLHLAGDGSGPEKELCLQLARDSFPQ